MKTYIRDQKVSKELYRTLSEEDRLELLRMFFAFQPSISLAYLKEIDHVILTKEDFQKVNFDNDNQDFPLPVQANKPGEILEKINSQEGILLTEKGLKKVIKAFEDKITTSVQYENSKLSYQKIIIKQVLAYKRVIAGEENEYKSFYFK